MANMDILKVWTESDVCFELKDNLTDATVLNTGKTGNIYQEWQNHTSLCRLPNLSLLTKSFLCFNGLMFS